MLSILFNTNWYHSLFCLPSLHKAHALEISAIEDVCLYISKHSVPESFKSHNDVFFKISKEEFDRSKDMNIELFSFSYVFGDKPVIAGKFYLNGSIVINSAQYPEPHFFKRQ